MTYNVRPLMHPVNRRMRVFFMSTGSTQLLVGPASSALQKQMNVRSSVRATSEGSERQR